MSCSLVCVILPNACLVNNLAETMREKATKQHTNYFAGKQCEVYPPPLPSEQDRERSEDVGTLVDPDISMVCNGMAENFV